MEDETIRSRDRCGGGSIEDPESVEYDPVPECSHQEHGNDQRTGKIPSAEPQARPFNTCRNRESHRPNPQSIMRIGALIRGVSFGLLAYRLDRLSPSAERPARAISTGSRPCMRRVSGQASTPKW